MEGYVSTYDRDLGGDVVVPGAFKKTLGDGHKVRFLYSHQPNDVLGVPITLEEDGRKGLYGRFKISKTARGEDVRTLLLDGALDSFSIGYLAKDFEHDPRSGVRRLEGAGALGVLRGGHADEPRRHGHVGQGAEEPGGGVPGAARGPAQGPRVPPAPREETPEQVRLEVDAMRLRLLLPPASVGAAEVATPGGVVPPSQWTRTRLVVQQTSHDPAAEAQLRRRREDDRRNWEAARAIAPQVREAKRRLEEELLPQAERDVAEAVAAVEAAQDRLVLKNVAEQGNEVWDVGGPARRAAHHRGPGEGLPAAGGAGLVAGGAGRGGPAAGAPGRREPAPQPGREPGAPAGGLRRCRPATTVVVASLPHRVEGPRRGPGDRP